MAHTKRRNDRKNDRKNTGRTGPAGASRARGERRALRREVPCTVGLLADEQDFAAMRRYRSFTFADHRRYLRQIDGLLRSLADEGAHTAVALFDPEDFAEYCAETGLDPDTAASRSRFTAHIASTGGAVLPYTGQPVAHLVPQLVNTAVRRVTWECATMTLAELGACADCGVDIGRASFDRASRLLTHLIERAGPGTHHIVCSVPTPDEQLLAALHVQRPPTGPARLDASESAEFVTVLAAAASHSTATEESCSVRREPMPRTGSTAGNSGTAASRRSVKDRSSAPTARTPTPANRSPRSRGWSTARASTSASRTRTSTAESDRCNARSFPPRRDGKLLQQVPTTGHSPDSTAWAADRAPSAVSAARAAAAARSHCASEYFANVART